jgi:hypothetical protein
MSDLFTPAIGLLVKERLLQEYRSQTQNSWTVQGFGMLRCYLDSEKVYRLNIWSSTLAISGVSVVHDHPWHLSSLILSGKICNVRYVEVPLSHRDAVDFHGQRIKTGEGGGPEGERFDARLRYLQPETYGPGDTYAQRAEEIHCSDPDDGAVTLNCRERVGDGEHARVFWPYGEEWVDAEPRPASYSEVRSTIASALERWSA